MKEFKASENIEKDKLVENIDKKFEEDLKEIKDKLNAEKLSDEFKENLQAKLEEELNKDTSKSKGKILQFPVITRKLAVICACFVLLFSSCFAFADDIENVIFKIFGDTDRIIENAIANGNYKKINMDYVENNGVSIKVDYVVVEDDNLYIAFNVLGEEEFDKIYFKRINIKNEFGEVLLDNSKQVGDYKNSNYRIDKKNVIIVYNINFINFAKSGNHLDVELQDLLVKRNGGNKEFNEIWNIKIDL